MTGRELQRCEDWDEDWWQVHVTLSPEFQEMLRRSMDDVANRRTYRMSWVGDEKYTLTCSRCLGDTEHEPDHTQCLNLLYDNDRCDCNCGKEGSL